MRRDGAFRARDDSGIGRGGSPPRIARTVGGGVRSCVVLVERNAAASVALEAVGEEHLRRDLEDRQG